MSVCGYMCLCMCMCQIDMSDVIDNAAQMVHDNGLSDGTCGVGVYVGVWLYVCVCVCVRLT